MLNELRNRGVKDILILCADGLTGIKEAIAAAYPQTEYQRCIVHQVRNTLKYVAEKDRKSFANDLKTMCLTGSATAATLDDGAVLSGEMFIASSDDESAIDLSGSSLATVTNALVQKTAGDVSSTDAASFRGVNSAVRVYDSAVLTISDSVIEASASNATGVFAYDGGTIHISDCTVTVTGGGAGGVQVAGGGTLIGENLTVTSASKAAIRSDRGGGTMVLEGGVYTSTGKNGCPAIYSTANITVKNAACVSEQSRAVIIEGKNTVTVENCILEGNDQSSKEGSVKANVLLYQSASGDASDGTSVFTMAGGEMTCHSGAMFYCTNTDSVINLTGAALNLSEDGPLLIVSAGRWGKEGRNGGDCALNAVQQTLEGAIIVDEISSLTMELTDSSFTGSINASGEAGEVIVTLAGDSTWMLTENSYITALNGDTDHVDLDGHTLYISGVAWNGTN